MAQLHFVEFGPRKVETPQDTLVFIGSIGSTVDMWLPQLDALSDVFRVIAVDHRGHGGSPGVEGPASVADLAQDVQETIAQLGVRSEEHTSELQSRGHLVCRLLLEKKIHNYSI